MSQTDPIADFLTIIRNGQMAHHAEVTAPSSKMKLNIARILKEEGYITNYKFDQADGKPVITVMLKYDDEGRPIMRKLERVSKPGRRVYCGVEDLPKVLNGLGVAIVTTSRGVLSGEKAREMGVGGEILARVW